MTVKQLEERILKAREKAEKKETLIAKNEKSIEKKIKALNKLGVEYKGQKIHSNELKAQGLNEQDAWDACWLTIDIKNLEDRNTEIPKEIAEINNTIKKYEAQMAGEIEKESIFTKEIPDTMKVLQEELEAQWNTSDFERRAFLRNQYSEMGYKEFIKKFKYAGYEFKNLTDEEIMKRNEKDAKLFVLDLYNRVKEITGEVTDWHGISLDMGNAYPVLSGIVIGKEGRAKVETIYAGGYNIQRLHIRTLVHSI